MERKREKRGVGQRWGLQRAPRGIRWVSRCPGVPLPEAISSGHHPHRVCPGPASGSQQAVSFPFCPQERTLGFQQRGSSFLKRDSCLRLAATSHLLGLNAQVSYGVLLSLPLSLAPGPLWLLTHHQGAMGSASAPGLPPALQPPGQRAHPSPPTVMKSPLC